jgi:acyl-CoA-binding protein
MADLQSDFDAAVASSKKLAQRPDNSTLLKIYGLYKQATQGDVTEKKPGFGDMIGRAKWDAWNAVKGTAHDDAKRRYVELIQSLG